jgi:hypothetical protein
MATISNKIDNNVIRKKKEGCTLTWTVAHGANIWNKRTQKIALLNHDIVL